MGSNLHTKHAPFLYTVLWALVNEKNYVTNIITNIKNISITFQISWQPFVVNLCPGFQFLVTNDQFSILQFSFFQKNI